MMSVDLTMKDIQEKMCREKSCLFDTHAHYDHLLFGGNGPQIVRRLFENNVVDGIVIPAITYDSNFNREMFPVELFPNVFFAAGLHPKCATNESWWPDAKIEEFEKFLSDTRTVAIKTGLDFSKKKLSDGQKENQIRFFKYLIGRANDTGFSLVLHVRNAVAEVISVLREERLKVEAVIHCYTYDKETAQELMEAGITRFGIGGMLTRENMEPLRECVKDLPLSKILIETDAPFVKPVGYSAALNTSETMIDVVKLVSMLKQLSIEEVVNSVQANAHCFYGR